MVHQRVMRVRADDLPDAATTVGEGAVLGEGEVRRVVEVRGMLLMLLLRRRMRQRRVLQMRLRRLLRLVVVGVPAAVRECVHRCCGCHV